MLNDLSFSYGKFFMPPENSIPKQLCIQIQIWVALFYLTVFATVYSVLFGSWAVPVAHAILLNNNICSLLNVHDEWVQSLLALNGLEVGYCILSNRYEHIQI